MKKQGVVKLTYLAAMAAFLAGCNRQREVVSCVDQNNVVQEDRYCEDADRQKAQYHNVPPTPVPPWWYYHWLYGGISRTGNYYPGSPLWGGRMAPSSGMQGVRGSSLSSGAHVEGGVVRGGFGSIGRGGFGHGGGE